MLLNYKEILKNQINEKNDLLEYASNVSMKIDLSKLKTSFVSNIDINTISENERYLSDLTNCIREGLLTDAFNKTYQTYKSPIHKINNDSINASELNYNYERCMNFNDYEKELYNYVEGYEGFTLLYNSGMASLTSILAVINKLYNRKIYSATAVGYYETILLLNDHKNTIENTFLSNEDASSFCDHSNYDFYLFEPVRANFSLKEVPIFDFIDQLIIHRRQKLQFVIFDISFLGESFSIESVLDRFSNEKKVILIFYRSGIKLDQEGLELTNIGIMSLYCSSDLHFMFPQLFDHMKDSRSRMGLTISLFESQLLNSIIENNRKLYSNSILKNTKEFVDNITIPSFSMFDSLNYPNKQVGSDYHLTPYFFLTIKENLEDDYIKLVKIIKFKLGLYNCDANFRTSFGFRNISFEYLRNSGNNSEKVFKIAPGKLTGLSYYVIQDIINECSQLSLEEFRGINIEEFERI